MTSKTLLTSLFKGELRRKLWLYIISLLVVLLAGPMALLLRIDNMLIWATTYTREQLIFELMPSVSCKNTITMLLCIALAIVFAFSLFGYLYIRQAVDLYHSLAIKRKDIFTVFTVSAVIPALVIFIIDTLLKAGVLATKNLISPFIMKALFSTLIYEIIFFLLIFFIAVIAIMLTGNRLVGLLGTIGLMVIAPLTESVITSYCAFCFQSYQNISLSFNWITYLLTPFNQMNMYDYFIGNSISKVLVTVFEVIILGFVAYYLFKKRPSECTNQALCYKPFATVVRVYMTIYAALFGGIYVVYIWGNLPAQWYLASFLIVGILTFVLINSVIKGDIKKALKEWPQLVGGLIVAALFASLFLFDITGFDGYIPDKDKIEYAAIATDSIDSSISNFDIVDNGNGYNLNYTYYIEHRLNNMKSKNIDTYIALAEIGINTQSTQSAFTRHLPTEYIEPQDNLCSYILCFHLKNGRDVIRFYQAPIDTIRPLLSEVYSSTEYKDSICQLQDYIDKDVFSKITGNDRFGEEIFSLSGENVNGLLAAVRQDYYAMSLNNLANEEPLVGFSVFDKFDNYTDGMYGYYIYPSSKNTLNYLSALGINIDTSSDILTTDAIQTISVEKYYDNGSAHADYNPTTDSDIVKAIHDVMVIDTYSYDNAILKNYDYDINITCNYLTTTGYMRSCCVRVPKDSLPDRVYNDVREEKIQ